MMLFTKKQTIVAVALALVMVFSNAFAQTSPTPLSSDEKAKLQQELADLQNQINQYQAELGQIQGQKNTLQNKINQLKKQQASLTLQIQATSLEIKDINNRLADTQAEIVRNAAVVEKLTGQIAALIRASYMQDDTSLLYTLLSQDNFSDILTEMENYSQISTSLNSLVGQIHDTNNKLNQERVVLAEQEDDATSLLALHTVQKGQLAGIQTEQTSLLEETKGQEANYQAVLNDKRQAAAEIQSRLYPLLGVPSQITFGQAVEIAQWASGQTGVRASFLLAILTQESNLGKNVGTCNRPGDPATKSYKVVMKPDRDIKPFLTITGELGMDPEVTPVSCPMKNKDGSFNGWGGAMGPAQFIPSTWMGYKDKVSALTGKPANPWDIRDAFLASAIKLKAGGAGTVAGEWAAAMRYFSGGTNVKYRFYGDNVVAVANKYQADIDNLKY